VSPASDTFSPAEREAITERAKEVRSPKGKKPTGLEEMMDKISAMSPTEQTMARRLHELVTATAPHLVPKTWYGMPAWTKNGKVICFFQAASKFGTRYSTLGFDEHATLDSGDWWPTAFAIVDLTQQVEKKVAALIKKAA
jgi:uncharacterized protein YdhG (YjbR/CyaY superfamily)